MKGLRKSGRGIRSRRGFTLLEIMFAVFMGAAILVAATTFVFSLGELWGKGANIWLFQKHVRGVSRFLEQSFQTSSWKLSNGEAESVVYWSNRGGREYENEELLTFELEKSPGVLVWPEDPLPYVVCSLELDDEDGLYLLWRSRLEEDFGEEEPRKTLISPFVKRIRYFYIDTEDENADWEVEEDPVKEADGTFTLPQRIEIVFEYEGREEKRQIPLPSLFDGVPMF
jgi:prepilin-type N-terminal cleavage/methylation domain-containing protein